MSWTRGLNGENKEYVRIFGNTTVKTRKMARECNPRF
jgi:hypothetical protein